MSFFAAPSGSLLRSRFDRHIPKQRRDTPRRPSGTDEISSSLKVLLPTASSSESTTAVDYVALHLVWALYRATGFRKEIRGSCLISTAGYTVKDFTSCRLDKRKIAPDMQS